MQLSILGMSKDTQWIIDINAIHDLTYDKHHFINFKPFLHGDSKVYLSNDTTLSIYSQGEVEILIENKKTLHLFNALYVLDVHKNVFLICDYNLKGSGILIKNQ